MNISNYPLYTALITPLKEDSSVDYDALEGLLREQEEANNGILVLGSTGEALNLDKEEKEKIFKFASDLNLKVPLMAGIGGINLRETLEDINFLNELNYHCYLLVTPLYAKPGKVGQTEWFKALLDNSKKPCMLYNVPSRTGTSLNIETVSELNSHPNFWAIKEASGSVDDFKNYVGATNGQLVYSGDDALMNDFARHGAKGLVSVASNVWPKETNIFVQKCLNNDLENEDEWKTWSNSLFEASNPIPTKVLMNELGRINSPICRPPLSHQDLQSTENLINVNNSVKNWL